MDNSQLLAFATVFCIAVLFLLFITANFFDEIARLKERVCKLEGDSAK